MRASSNATQPVPASAGGRPPQGPRPPTGPPEYDPKNLLVGAKAISKWLFGTEAKVRQVYYLCEKGNLPHFHLGSRLAADASVLALWMWKYQSRHFPTPDR